MELLRQGCAVCGQRGGALCGRCEAGFEAPPSTAVRGVGRVPAAFAYDGAGARAVQVLKFRDGRRLVAPLADRLVAALEPGLVPDVVSWIPTSPRRRRRRGFDQAELLARAVARRLGRPCRPTLRRRPGPAQTGRDRRHRATNVAFEAVRPVPVAVLLVDDVCTTGATARAACSALTEAGAGEIRVAVVARTP